MNLFADKKRSIFLIVAVAIIFFSIQLYENITDKLEYREKYENRGHDILKAQFLKSKKEFTGFLNSKMFHTKNNPRTKELLRSHNIQENLKVEKRRFEIMHLEDGGLLFQKIYLRQQHKTFNFTPKDVEILHDFQSPTATKAFKTKRRTVQIIKTDTAQGLDLIYHLAEPIYGRDNVFLGVIEFGYSLKKVAQKTDTFLLKALQKDSAKSTLLYFENGNDAVSIINRTPTLEDIVLRLNKKIFLENKHIYLNDRVYNVYFLKNSFSDSNIVLMSYLDVTQIHNEMKHLIYLTILKFFIFVVMISYVITYMFNSFAKKVSYLHNRSNSILNSQKDIVIVTNAGISLSEANQAFLDFFDYKSLKIFKQNHSCICDLFVQESGYLSPKIHGLTWVEYALLNPEKTHLVKMKRKGKSYIFKIYAKATNEQELKNNEVVVTFVDITHELENEQKLRQNQKVLEKVFETSPDAIKIIDPTTKKPIFFNFSAFKMLGYSKDEYKDLTIEQYDSKHSKEQIGEKINQILHKKVTNFESKHRKKDGSIIDVEVHTKTIDIDNKPYILAMYKDITTRKKQEKQLKHLNEKLQDEVHKQVDTITQKDKLLQEQAKLAAMGEMIGAIAHQWRQPLNALSINIQNLDDDYEDGLIDEAFVHEFIAKQTKTINFMSKTIDDFRNFFKTDKSKSIFSIHEVAQSVVHLLNAQLKNHNIAIEIYGEDFKVQSYKSEMQQVFLNLISNSKDAIIKSKIQDGKIKVYIDAQNQSISINDNGGGVEDDKLSRIFEPYYTTKEQGKGTGIGLHMSRIIIVDHMHGHINASNTDQGLQIDIKLPHA